MTDTDKWAESTDEQLYEIAKDWAKKFAHWKLRAFQTFYARLQTLAANDVESKCYQNMWQCATYAISIKCFGK